MYPSVDCFIGCCAPLPARSAVVGFGSTRVVTGGSADLLSHAAILATVLEWAEGNGWGRAEPKGQYQGSLKY